MNYDIRLENDISVGDVVTLRSEAYSFDCKFCDKLQLMTVVSEEPMGFECIWFNNKNRSCRNIFSKYGLFRVVFENNSEINDTSSKE